MANSKYTTPAYVLATNQLKPGVRYEYVKAFEQSAVLLPNTFIVVRIDGRGFHKLTAKYDFERPNDRRGLGLMNDAAAAVMKEIPEIVLAYGLSDEFSFVLDRSCSLFDRRESKIVTTVVSTFTSYYTHLWPCRFPGTPLSPPLPSFDGRAVQYPSAQNLRDYLSWRQADCHINNLFNTTFWAMVQQGGMSATEAEAELKGTLASDKNEILFSRFKHNYNNEPEMFRKGSVLYRDLTAVKPDAVEDISPAKSTEKREVVSKTQERKRQRANVVTEHVDIIHDGFWNQRSWLLPA